MSASDLHEDRVRLLTTLGMIGGCHLPIRLEPLLTPDGVMLDRRRRRLLIGDAKATETPANAATARRLRRYLRAARAGACAGYVVRVALCCSGDGISWERLLLRVAADVAVPVTAHGHERLDAGHTLAWIDLGADIPADRHAPKRRDAPGHVAARRTSLAAGP